MEEFRIENEELEMNPPEVSKDFPIKRFISD